MDEEKYLVIKVTNKMVRHFTYNNELFIVESMGKNIVQMINELPVPVLYH